MSLTRWNSGQLSSYQYTLASSRRLQRCTRILGARRVNETASLTGSREMLVLWLRHEVLETFARGKAGDKSSASQQSKNVPSEARKQCASRKTLRHSDGCAEKDGHPQKTRFPAPRRTRRWLGGSPVAPEFAGKWRRKRLHAQSVSPRHPRRIRGIAGRRRCDDTGGDGGGDEAPVAGVQDTQQT